MNVDLFAIVLTTGTWATLGNDRGSPCDSTALVIVLKCMRGYAHSTLFRHSEYCCRVQKASSIRLLVWMPGFAADFVR